MVLEKCGKQKQVKYPRLRLYLDKDLKKEDEMEMKKIDDPTILIQTQPKDLHFCSSDDIHKKHEDQHEPWFMSRDS